MVSLSLEEELDELLLFFTLDFFFFFSEDFKTLSVSLSEDTDLLFNCVLQSDFLDVEAFLPSDESSLL